MVSVPHLVQYQGSKRAIASKITKYIPAQTQRIIEPFAGTCAVSILAAFENRCDNFLLNDINQPLLQLMEACVNEPEQLTELYARVWEGQYENGQDNIGYYYKIRDEFNMGSRDPARMLFLLARVVKGAVRYNAQGMMNQSCDKRRFGTRPNIVRKNAVGISRLLKGKAQFVSLDYREVLRMAKPGDLVYMDPPYQGTSNKDNSRDNRYIQGVDFDEFVSALEYLNDQGIDYIVSYDGMTGEKVIGKSLPTSLRLTHLYIEAGLSAQAMLNGKKEITYESLYLSPNISIGEPLYEQMKMNLA